MKDEKICVITGANSPIGFAMAERFLGDFHLILCWHNKYDRLKALPPHSGVEAFRFDLQHEAECRTLIEYCFENYGKIDLLVNCIGKNSDVQDAEIMEADLDDVLAVNLKPAFFLCKYIQKRILTASWAPGEHSSCVINISSTAGIRALPSSPHYIAAKAGLIAVSKYYAKVMAPHVRVNTIAPGFVETEKHSAPRYDELRSSIPMKRFAKPSEIADAAAFIASNDYITGQTIIVDGGMIS